MTSQAYYNEQRKQRGCDKLGITQGQWSYIKRVGSILNQLYTNSCNGFQTFSGKEDERRAKWNEQAETRYESNAYKFAKDNNLHIYLQTDPRGATIYLDTKPIPDNNYTIATCIY